MQTTKGYDHTTPGLGGGFNSTITWRMENEHFLHGYVMGKDAFVIYESYPGNGLMLNFKGDKYYTVVRQSPSNTVDFLKREARRYLHEVVTSKWSENKKNLTNHAHDNQPHRANTNGGWPMQIPDELAKDKLFTLLIMKPTLETADYMEAASRAEQLGFYAVASDLKTAAANGKREEIGMFSGTKGMTNISALIRTAKEENVPGYASLIVADALEEDRNPFGHKLREVVELYNRWRIGEVKPSDKKGTLKDLMWEWDFILGNAALQYRQQKTMSSFLSKALNMPRVKCGFLKKRKMGVKPEGSCGCNACQHNHH